MLLKIAILAVIATCVLTQHPLAPENPTLSYSTWTSATLGENLGSVWKVMILACLALMLIDAICRAKGTKLFGTGVFYLTRFIWFIYGTAVCYMAGIFVPHGYRGFTQDIYHQFQEEIYDAYLGSKWVRVFRNPMKIGDVPVDTNILIENALFIEVIIILVCRFFELITISNLKNGNTISNWFGTTRKVFAIFLALYWWAYAMLWFQNIH
jgi:hypothetical protein